MKAACFFDLDGTLADTRAGLAATVNETRRDLGLAPLSVDKVVVHVGQGARNLLLGAIPEAATDYESVLGRYMDHYVEMCCHEVVAYPGIGRVLTELAARGVRLGVVTNKPAEPTRRILAFLGLDRFFGSAVVAGGDCPQLKPSAQPLLACAARLVGRAPGAADWMIGDSWTDLRCAEAAGVRAAFCGWGFGFLRDAPYDLRAERPEDLLCQLFGACTGQAVTDKSS